MAKSNSYSSKWPRLNKSTYGLLNIWYQSKTRGHLRRKQHLDFIYRELKRERQDQLGSCIKQISEDCKDMLKKKLQEIMQYNNTLNQPQLTNFAQNKYNNYKCFQCKQMGHIVKFCPMDNKDEDMVMKTDTRNLAKERKEGFKTTKPAVMLKYPESIHFSTTCMIKGTDHANWDDLWYISNHIDKHLCYKLDSFCNIKEDFSVKKLENQKKFLFTYEIGEVLIEDGGQGFEIKYDINRCTLVYMFNNKETQNFDEDRMRTMQNKYLEDYFESLTNKDEGIEEDLIRIKGNLYSTKVQTFNEYVIFLNLIMQDDIVHLFDLYKLIERLGGYLSVYFCQEFDIIGKIMGLSRGNGEEIKKCYMNYLDVFTSYFKTAIAPPQGNNNILNESTRNVEDKDIDCLVSHQWDFGETGAPIRKIAVPKGKETLEHFGVKLEDARDTAKVMISPSSLKNNQDLKAYDLREENMTTSSTNNSVFRGFFEKQKLTGPNFIDWYRQLRFVLSIEDKLNYLEQPIPPAPVEHAGQQVALEILVAHNAWIKGSKEIAGLMLMTLAEQELLQTTRDFHSCRQEERQSVSSYVLKMKGYIDNPERLGNPATLGLGVSLILIGLHKEYDGFMQNYNMHSMGKTVNELHAMLKLHEQTLPKSNALALNAIRAGKVQKGNKHKKSHSQTAARGRNHGKGRNKQAYAPKHKIPPPPKRENPANDSICHECGEIGHWKRNCPQYLAELIKKKKNTTSRAGGLGIFVRELNTILNRSWIYDTGCGTYICNTTQGLRASRKLKPGALSLYMGNGQREAVEAISTFYLCLPSGLEIVLNNCHYAPSITRGVISV
nr:zinc finger, CCHC-type [Tanacetum cinerariifolium]